MLEVFISYRQTNDEELKRVRGFGQQLRDRSVGVVLDQFFEEENAAGSERGLASMELPAKPALSASVFTMPGGVIDDIRNRPIR